MVEALLSLALVFLVGWVIFVLYHYNMQETRGRIDNVRRVFMHLPGHYSILYEKEGELHSKSFSSAWCKTKLVPDVAENESMYVEYSQTGLDYSRVVIHVYSAKAVFGGGWEDGDCHYGKTNVVE